MSTMGGNNGKTGRMLKSSGFTIVELLIVIVVIGILAAIVIVAFNGIQNRAANTSIEADLSNLSKQVSMFHATEGRYPQNSTDVTNLGIKLSKSSYRSNGNNFIFCYETGASGGTKFGVMAISKVDNIRYIISNDQKNPVVTTAMSSMASGNDICPALGITSNHSWWWLCAGDPCTWVTAVQS